MLKPMLAFLLLLWANTLVAQETRSPKGDIGNDFRVRKELTKMKSTQQALTKISTPHEQAIQWLELTRSAERLAEVMNEKLRQDLVNPSPAHIASESALPDVEKLAKHASSYGVSIGYCDPSGSWSVASTGYQRYVQLWPDGPSADEAWWKSRVEGDCGDFEGTVEEYKGGIAMYEEFLTRFPASVHAAEAKQQLEMYRNDLRELEAEHSKPHGNR